MFDLVKRFRIATIVLKFGKALPLSGPHSIDSFAPQRQSTSASEPKSQAGRISMQSKREIKDDVAQAIASKMDLISQAIPVLVSLIDRFDIEGLSLPAIHLNSALESLHKEHKALEGSVGRYPE